MSASTVASANAKHHSHLPPPLLTRAHSSSSMNARGGGTNADSRGRRGSRTPPGGASTTTKHSPGGHLGGGVTAHPPLPPDARSAPPRLETNSMAVASGEVVNEMGVLVERSDAGGQGWGSNFWVTIVDPQTNVPFYACPSNGQVSWDPPAGTFVCVKVVLLPPSEGGEWWELADESRGGIPYYYHTKTRETVWDRPEGFVIPLGVLQNTSLGRRLSLNLFGSMQMPSTYAPGSPTSPTSPMSPTPARINHARSESGSSTGSTGKRVTIAATPSPSRPPASRRSLSAYPSASFLKGPRPHLSPIPASPDVSDVGSTHTANKRDARGSRSSLRPDKPDNQRSTSRSRARGDPNAPDEVGRMPSAHSDSGSGSANSSPARTRAKSYSYMPRASPRGAQSLGAAVEMLVGSESPSASPVSNRSSFSARRKSLHAEPVPPLPQPLSLQLAAPIPPRVSVSLRERISTDVFGFKGSPPGTPTRERSKNKKGNAGALPVPPSPMRPTPPLPNTLKSRASTSSLGRKISTPVFNEEATANMTPVRNRAIGKPILIPPEANTKPINDISDSLRPILPNDLVSDIQQFIESDFAKQYFSTHRAGFIFKRKIPIEQMMSWQKGPLSTPMLQLNRSLHKDALKVFRTIQRIMGDRGASDRPGVLRSQSSQQFMQQARSMMSDDVPVSPGPSALIEQQRSILALGITHGELRDEIYCQLMKQLCGNPSTESIFKGWQFFCVILITFPPSKDFETHIRSYFQQRTTQTEGRVDVMAKYCLRRLAFISKKGPRGKPPTAAEIETALDAAFNPSIFGESLDVIFRLQERSYPSERVPIILPFLSDGILALGGAKAEGIFRVPGDGDAVSDLRLRIERGHYTLDGVDDPHVLASLIKLWLRELLDPLIPAELYNECISHASEPVRCVQLIARLPTVNRRVVLFVINFLQRFLDPKIQAATKMTAVNLALVMAPNLLRCSSDSMAVVFTNAQYEQTFVHNLLLHLKCDEVDRDYQPGQALAARSRPSTSRTR